MRNFKKLVVFTISLSFLISGLANAAPIFIANLDESQIHPLDGGPSGSVGTGVASFNITPAGLEYSIQFNGLDLVQDPLERVDSDDITAIHIHIAPFGGKGPHALNIFGLAGGDIREDDADLNVDFANESLSGIWDDSDENFGADGAKDGPDSFGLSAMLDNLRSGGLYVQLHTVANPGGDIRGQINPVPEPSTYALMLLGLVGIGLRLRKTVLG